MIDGADTFDVVVTGFEPGDETPAVRLQRVFGIAPDAAERLLARVPAPVQRGVPRIRAEYFRRALLKIGAHVEVRGPDGAAVELMPSVPPPAPRRPSDRPSKQAPMPVPGAVAPPAAVELAAPELSAAVLSPAPPAAAISRGAPTALATQAAIAAPPAVGAKPYVGQQREPRLLLEDDDDIPLASSLRPESLGSGGPLAFDGPDAALPLDDLRPSPAFATPFGAGGATADTLIDSRRQSATTPNVGASPSAALGSSPHDTLADAVHLPAHATLSEGLKPKPDRAPQSAPRGAGTATVLHGKALVAPAPVAMPAAVAAPASAAAGVAPVEDSLFGDLPPSAAASGFRPPALELGLDGADAMSKLPSSIWDAPPKLGESARPPSAPRPAGNIEPSGGGPTPQLDLSGFPASASIEDPLDLPSTPAPGKVGRAPLQVGRPHAPRERPSKEGAPNEGPRARVGKVGAARVSKKAAEPEPEREPFWASAAQSLVLPLSGTGGVWLGLIVLWAFGAALLSAASMLVVALGVIVALATFTMLLALACDYFRACFWLAEEGGSALERAPSLAPSRILHSYLKSGAHLMVFALATGLLLIFLTIAGIGDGATPLELMSEPQTWVFGLMPALVWPGAVAMTALHNRYEAIWQLPVVIRIASRAPLEYLTVVAVGALIFGAGVWLLLALASIAGISGVLLSAVLGPPMALSHGVQGALMGSLMRARPELFR